MLGRSLLPSKHFQIQTFGVTTPGNPGQRTTESIFKQVTTSEIPELVSGLDGWGAPVLLVLRGLKNIHGVQGRKGIYFGKTWAQVATLWGKRNLESSYLENSFPRVAKSYPKVLCFPFWPLANFGCPLVCDGQPDYFTN